MTTFAEDQGPNVKRNPDGTMICRREIAQSSMLKCSFVILVADHYREDGSCKCDDATERARMIRDWEYDESAFKDIPLRKD